MSKIVRVLFVVVVAHAALAVGAVVPAGKTQNVVLIVTDGLRWQEVFTGADHSLMNAEHGGVWADPAAFTKQFWREDAIERRSALLPFLWGTVAQHGQIFGSQEKGSLRASLFLFGRGKFMYRGLHGPRLKCWSYIFRGGMRCRQMNMDLCT